MPSKKNLSVGLAATASLVAAGPCDIYEAGGTPCVAAHSTTRALFSAYDGDLYQVIRGSDNTTLNITPLTAGGVANAAAQTTFCASTTCLISIIYDQSGKGNDLTRAPPGGETAGPNPDGVGDNLASAIGAPVTLNGDLAYGVFISPGTGYRIDATNGVATGTEPEGLYNVVDGTHYNDGCCFDYGNAETSNTDTGDGHMESIYFGTETAWGTGAGSGPWLMADLENGLFSTDALAENPDDPTQTNRFVTGWVKGEVGNWTLRGGNGQSGGLTTYYSGPRPSGYEPMHKEGAIILGIGGDNSDSAQGTFYEGAMTYGYPSDAVEAEVQANIVAAGYAVTTLNSGPALSVGDSVSFHVTTPGYTTRYLAHTGATVNTQVISSSNTTAVQETASWIVRTGLGYSGCYSFESVDTPGSYIRHDDFVLYVDAPDGTTLFDEDATFCGQAGLSGEGNSLRAWEYPTRYIRHYYDLGYAASNGGPEAFDNPTSFNDDVTFLVVTGFQS